MNTCVRLKQRSFVVIDGLDVDPPTPQIWLQMDSCRNCTIRNCRMQNGGGSYHPALVSDCHYCRFQNLDVSRAMQLGSHGHVSGNMFGLYGSSHNVVQNRRFGKAGNDTINV